MYRVTYTSHASRLFNRTSLATITAVSGRNNLKAEMSGLLVYHDRRFFQVLEGEEETLSRLMTRIAADPRHQGLAIVEHGAVQQRAFTTWRACCASDAVPAEETKRFSALADLVPANSDLRGRDPNVRHHVRRFLAGLRNLPTVAAG